MEGHCSDDQNGPNRLMVSNIINRTVECDFIEIRMKHELKFWKSESSVYVDLTNYPIRNLVINMEGYYSNDQNGPNRLTVSNIISWTVEYDHIRIRTKLKLKLWKSESSL
jgi:hypothetical protein